MSNFIPRPNTGTLWPNRKVSQNHPDVRGDVFLDRAFLEGLLRKTGDDLVKIQVSGWNKVLAGKECLSLQVSEPYVKPEEARPQYSSSVDESDVPF
jgi:hypothetical protein